MRKAADPRPMGKDGGGTSLTPMMRQYKDIKANHVDAILFFRMGDFYEMFYEDAETAAPVLDLALTSRHDDAQGRIPMCGFPFHASDGYVARLVKAGYRVAICDQIEDPKKSKGLVRREVVQVVSPGTATQPQLLESKTGNYLSAISANETSIGFAFADLSTGEFGVFQWDGKERWSLLADEWADLEPKELLLPDDMDEDLYKFKNVGAVWENGDLLITRQPSRNFDPKIGVRTLKSGFGLGSLDGLGLDQVPVGTGAASALYVFLRNSQGDRLGHLRPPCAVSREESVLLDSATLRNLEILRAGPEGERNGTLLQVLDQTMTPMGGRMLRDWLLHPLVQEKLIHDRLETVREFKNNPTTRENLRQILGTVGDIERLMARLHLGSGNARDLRNLSRSLEVLPAIFEMVSKVDTILIRSHFSEWDNLADIVEIVNVAVVEEPPVSLKDGGLISAGYRESLDRLRLISQDAKSWIRSYEEKERLRTGIKNLKIIYNRVFGYCIEVSKRGEDQVPPDYTRRQTLANAERYITTELKITEEEVLDSDAKAREMEYEIFQEIREVILTETIRIQGVARMLATLDVLLTFAENASRFQYVEPVVDESGDILIEEGRHPVLEQSPTALEERFVPNHAEITATDRQVLVLTGPNMSGKSTYIRQVALIVLLAQLGSFVPAKSAKIGLVDRIFTRVGAHDRLQRGQSTFMVEMVETAYILHRATSKSLVILDEIGRGTSTYDGISIAWAVAEHLHGEGDEGPRTLFATHYHELAQLENRLPRVQNLTMLAKEYQGEVVFLRQVVEGTSDRSYGIHVARLAGFPRKILKRAEQMLETFEKDNQWGGGGTNLPSNSDQLSIFQGHEADLLEKIQGVDPNQLTPIEALNFLNNIKQRLE